MYRLCGEPVDPGLASLIHMHVRILGTAAGGGVPQWNCACANCSGIRSGTSRIRRRTQSSVAVSAEGKRWFLLNASPDLRVQIESFGPLAPPPGNIRGSSLEGVLLSNADLDHTLGLFMLREGPRLPVHASGATRSALETGLRTTSVLEPYAGLEWREPGSEFQPLLTRERQPSGLSFAFLPILGKAPRYLGAAARMFPGASVVMRIRDEKTGGELIYAPAVAIMDEPLIAAMREADLLLLDGTFFGEEEMRLTMTGSLTAHDMGHLPVGGEDGSLVRIRSLPARSKAYVHINNTNPMLDESSAEYREVRNAGWEIAEDGWSLAP